MKIYMHRGSGHYLGHTIIVVAKNKKNAKHLIKCELENHCLPTKLDEIEEFTIEEQVIYTDDGNY